MDSLLKDNVINIIRAFLANHVAYDVAYGKNAYNECTSCHSAVYWSDSADSIIHAEDCLVLTARNVLAELSK